MRISSCFDSLQFRPPVLLLLVSLIAPCAGHAAEESIRVGPGEAEGSAELLQEQPQPTPTPQTLPPPPPPPPNAAPAKETYSGKPRFMLYGAGHNSCLIMWDFSTDVLAVTQPCNNGDSRRFEWISHNGRLYSAYLYGGKPYCLTWGRKQEGFVLGLAPAPKGDHIDIQPCALNTPPGPKEMFNLKDGRIRTVDGRCWRENGNYVDLQACDVHNKSQLWGTRPVATR